MTKINRGMADHLLKWHLEYETTCAKTKDMRDAFVLIKYLLQKIDEMENKDAPI